MFVEALEGHDSTDWKRPVHSRSNYLYISFESQKVHKTPYLAQSINTSKQDFRELRESPWSCK